MLPWSLRTLRRRGKLSSRRFDVSGPAIYAKRMRLLNVRNRDAHSTGYRVLTWLSATAISLGSCSEGSRAGAVNSTSTTSFVEAEAGNWNV